jgi:uncharacterized protein (DUF1697 family)
MPLYVAFLRAINVGSRRVSMERLRRPLADLGYDEVSTFIASGNVIFRTPERAPVAERAVEDALCAALGFEVVAFVRPASTLGRVVEDQPFDGDGDLVHVGFLKKAVSAPARRALDALKTEHDTVVAAGKQVYWRAGAGLGRAAISGASIEKALGQPTTFRSLKMLKRLGAKLS